MERDVPRILIALLFVGLAACTQDKKDAALPVPGQGRRPQVYVLTEAKTPLSGYWNFPSPAALRDGLDARVESAEIADAAKGEEILREWNTRPIDLWILGPGLPQALFAKLKLPGAPGRKLLFIGVPQAPAVEGARAFEVQQSDVEEYFTELCRETWMLKCYAPKQYPGTLEPGAKRIALTADDADAWAQLEIHWLPAFKELLKAPLKAPQSSAPFLLDFFSGLVVVKAGPQMKDDSRVKFEVFRKNRMMKTLMNSGAAP